MHGELNISHEHRGEKEAKHLITEYTTMFSEPLYMY